MGDPLLASGVQTNAARQLAFESFGVRLSVETDTPAVLARLQALLPAHSVPCSPQTATVSFAVLSEGNGRYRLERDGSAVTRENELDLCLLLLEGQLRIYVGLNAPNRIFVHAGVVERGGRALVLPGLSFSGKTTLVAALVRSGLRYYSDEFAVFDESGLVHPFAKPLSIRDHTHIQNDHDVVALGGSTGETPVRVGAVILTEYRPGASWQPRTLTHGRGVLALLQHTLPAMERHQEALRALKAATEDAVLLEGERGEAAELIGPLLELVDKARTGPPARGAR